LGLKVIDVLKALFGPKRALHIWVALYRWGHLLWLIPLICAVAALSIHLAGREHDFEAYLEGEVRFSDTVAGETSGARYSFIVALPDGAMAHVLTDNLTLATQVVGTACVEVRRFRDSRRPRYRLVESRLCR
jgi:hypothetical protein